MFASRLRLQVLTSRVISPLSDAVLTRMGATVLYLASVENLYPNKRNTHIRVSILEILPHLSRQGSRHLFDYTYVKWGGDAPCCRARKYSAIDGYFVSN